MKNNEMKYLVIVLVYIFSGSTIIGQQLSLSNFYNNNSGLFNPAAWNTDILKYSFLPKKEVSIFYRSQWTGLDLGPKYIGGQFNLIGSNSMIMGLGFIQESFGPLNYSTISGRYSYKIKINQKSFLSGGGALGIHINSYDPSKVTIRDKNDPIAESAQNKTALLFSPGIFYSGSLNKDLSLMLGLAYQNAVSLNLSKVNNFKPIPSLIVHGSIFKFLNAGYSNLSYFEFSFAHKRFQNISDDTDLGVKYQWKGLIALKTAIRMGILNQFSLHGVHIDLGIPLSNALKYRHMGIDLNYSCDVPLHESGTSFGLTHEVSIGLLF